MCTQNLFWKKLEEYSSIQQKSMCRILWNGAENIQIKLHICKENYDSLLFKCQLKKLL